MIKLKYKHPHHDFNNVPEIKKMVNELLIDFPYISEVTISNEKDNSLLIDDSKLDDPAFFINDIKEKLRHEVEIEYTPLSQNVNFKGDQKLLIVSRNGDSQYYNILPVLNKKSLSTTESLFLDYGVFYENIDKDNKLSYKVFKLTKDKIIFGIDISMEIPYFGYGDKDNTTGFSIEFNLIQLWNSEVSIKENNYLLKDPSAFQNFKTTKTYDLDGNFEKVYQAMVHKLRYLADLDNVKTIEITKNGDIFLDDKRVLIFEDILDKGYSRGYVTGLQFGIHDLRDGLIITPNKSIKTQKRRTVISTEDVYVRLTEWKNRILLILKDEKELILKLNSN